MALALNKIPTVATCFAAVHRCFPCGRRATPPTQEFAMDSSQSDTSARFNRSSYLYRMLDAAIVVICGLAVTELKLSLIHI